MNDDPLEEMRTGRVCAGRNVRADRLEPALWREIRAKLTTLEVIIQELRRGQPEPDREEVDRLEDEISRLTERERRLIKLYSFGEIDDAVLQSEIADLKQQRTILEERLREVRPTVPLAASILPDVGLVERACRPGSGSGRSGSESGSPTVGAHRVD